MGQWPTYVSRQSARMLCRAFSRRTSHSHGVRSMIRTDISPSQSVVSLMPFREAVRDDVDLRWGSMGRRVCIGTLIPPPPQLFSRQRLKSELIRAMVPALGSVVLYGPVTAYMSVSWVYRRGVVSQSPGTRLVKHRQDSKSVLEGNSSHKNTKKQWAPPPLKP